MPVTAESVLLVTLGFDPPTFERLDALRQRYFPPERNFIPAHVSLFHHLPGSEEPAITDALAQAAGTTAPVDLRFRTPRKMDRGFLLVVDAPEVARVHGRLVRQFDPWLTPQDRQLFRSHVTVMNKADKNDAAEAFREFQIGWSPWQGVGDRLILWEYQGGPWDLLAEFPFRGDPQ